MNRELLSKAVGDIDDRFVAEARFSVPGDTTGSPERIVHMKKKRIITFALAAALILALGAGAYAIGAFGGNIEIAAPSSGSNLGVSWEPHDNLATAEIEAMLAKMEGKKWSSGRLFGSVRDMEDAYGIELLKLGSEEGSNVSSDVPSAELRFYVYGQNDASSGAYLSGHWNAREDGVKITNKFYYYFDSPYISTLNHIHQHAEIEGYHIRSLGVTAQLISFWSGPTRILEACFSYGGIDYIISAILDPYESEGINPDDITKDWLCEKLETLQKPSWVSETAGPSWETTSTVTAFSGTDYPNLHRFDAEAAGPSGVILSKNEVDHDASDQEDDPYTDVDVLLTALWAPHDNLPTAEMEALLAETDPKEPFSYQSFDSVDEMEDAYGIELLHLKAENSYVDGMITSTLADNAAFRGYWDSTVKGISIKTFARYPFIVNNEAITQKTISSWKNIDKEAEYKIRRLGVTARLVSGVEGTEEAKQCVMAFFTYEGVDYCITATADGGKAPTIRWLCRQLETLRK